MSAAVALDLVPAAEDSGVFHVAPSARSQRELIFIAAWIASIAANLVHAKNAINSFIGWLWQEGAPSDAPDTDREELEALAVVTAVGRFAVEPELFSTPKRAKAYARGIVQRKGHAGGLWWQYLDRWSKGPKTKTTKTKAEIESPWDGGAIDVTHMRGVPRFDDEQAGAHDDEGDGIQWPGDAPASNPWAYGCAIDAAIDMHRAAEARPGDDLERWYDHAISWAEDQFLERHEREPPELLELTEAAALEATESVGQAVLCLLANGFEVPRLKPNETVEVVYERLRKALEKKVNRHGEMSPPESVPAALSE